eukprot:SAG31_NODE_2623_length_5361_cov_97.321361_3_plen_54_part_00
MLHPTEWNANPFDRPTASARYNKLPNYMWDFLMRAASECVRGCNGTGCIAQSV